MLLLIHTKLSIIVKYNMIKLRILKFLMLFAAIFLYGCGDSPADQTANNPARERVTAVAGYEIKPRDLSRSVRVSGNGRRQSHT